jgi:hypothetical protein
MSFDQQEAGNKYIRRLLAALHRPGVWPGIRLSRPRVPGY